MNATEATRHQQEPRRDSQQLAGLQSAQTDITTDVVPLIVRGLVRAHRFSALVAAVLITLLLVWVFAHEKIGIPSGPTPVAAHMDTTNDTRPAAA
jgi:RsiW-degrading membrane proteinase PrsW (M82 family)